MIWDENKLLVRQGPVETTDPYPCSLLTFFPQQHVLFYQVIRFIRTRTRQLCLKYRRKNSYSNCCCPVPPEVIYTNYLYWYEQQSKQAIRKSNLCRFPLASQKHENLLGPSGPHQIVGFLGKKVKYRSFHMMQKKNYIE